MTKRYGQAFNSLDDIDKKYQIIYADPPWHFKVYNNKTGLGRSAEKHYNTLILDDIKNLNIPSDKNSVLFLWIPCCQLQEGLEVIKSWGFEFKTVAFVWIKKTKKTNGLFWGMGFWTRSNAELCLLATKGKISRIRKDIHQVVMSKAREHSRKPDEVRERIVKLMGDLPRIELFARQRFDGWDAFGNETGNTVQKIL